MLVRPTTARLKLLMRLPPTKALARLMPPNPVLPKLRKFPGLAKLPGFRGRAPIPFRPATAPSPARPGEIARGAAKLGIRGALNRGALRPEPPRTPPKLGARNALA